MDSIPTKKSNSYGLPGKARGSPFVIAIKIKPLAEKMKITIAIPTISGREKYLESALKTCVTQDYCDVEIIVSDNSPGDALEVVQRFKDKRIRYIRPDHYLPMSAHWDFMASYFSGDMVTIIGDDDGLMPGALRQVSEMVTQYGKKPIQHALGQYGWPDIPDEALKNKFWLVHPHGKAISLRRSQDFLLQLCQAKVRYIDGPMIYHNFIPVDLINQLSINGSIFHRSSPDLYSAITIAAHSENFISTKEVLTISGIGAKSNGASVRNGGADGTRFINEMIAPQYLPRYKSITVQLQTLDSILEASERYVIPKLKDWINYGEHFCGAANECLDMPIRSRAARQMAILVWEATKNGCLPFLLRDRGAKFLEKIGQTLRGKHGVSEQAAEEPEFNTDFKYAVPTEVTDIYSATMHVNQLLKDRYKP